jgi:hypothetical protein
MALGGVGSGNGDFTSDEVYTFDWLAPTVAPLDAPDVKVAGATVYTFHVTYCEALARASLGGGNLSVRGPEGLTLRERHAGGE